MAQLISDAEMVAILTDMVDSQVPALSPIKSPKRRDYDSPVNEIPDAEPAPKKHKTDEGSKSIRIVSLHWRPDEPNVNSRSKSRENTQRTLRVPTACSTDQNHTSGSTKKFQTALDQISQSPSPYGAAYPYNRTAGKEFSCRQIRQPKPSSSY